MKKFSVIFLLFLFACKSNNPHIVQTFPQDQNLERKQRAGNMFGNKDGIILFEDKSNKEEKLTEEKPKKPKKIVPIDNNLWEKTVNFVSSILPILFAVPTLQPLWFLGMSACQSSASDAHTGHSFRPGCF